MKLRARIATVITMLLVFAGVSAGVHANASSTNPWGCVVVYPVKTVVCVDGISK